MARICEICGSVETGIDDGGGAIEFLYICDNCRTERES